MERFLFGFTGVLLGTILTAYLLYVAALSFVTLAMILLGFVLMFTLGLCIGNHRLLTRLRSFTARHWVGSRRATS